MIAINIVPFRNKDGKDRFRLERTADGSIVDDAQGYGFKTVESAHAFADSHDYFVILKPEEPIIPNEPEQLSLF